MLELDKWAKDKPILIAMFSQQLAIGALSLLTVLEAVKNQKLIKDPDVLPTAKQWINLYKDHRRVNNYLDHTFKKLGIFNEKMIEFAGLLSNIEIEKKRLAERDVIENFRKQLSNLGLYDGIETDPEAHKSLKEAYQKNLADLRAEISGQVDPDSDAQIQKHSRDPELIFFFKVMLPCLLLQGRAPKKSTLCYLAFFLSNPSKTLNPKSPTHTNYCKIRIFFTHFRVYRGKGANDYQPPRKGENKATRETTYTRIEY